MAHAYHVRGPAVLAVLFGSPASVEKAAAENYFILQSVSMGWYSHTPDGGLLIQLVSTCSHPREQNIPDQDARDRKDTRKQQINCHSPGVASDSKIPRRKGSSKR